MGLQRFSARWVLAFWLAGCLIVPIAADAQPAAPDPLRLGDDVVPVFEAIRLKVDAGRTNYTGSVRIDLKVKRATSRFRFHAEEMQLNTIRLEGAGGAVELEHETGETGLVTLISGRPLEPGDYTLTIEFANEFGTRAVGLYRMEQDGQGYVFTQFEADDAREAFPCWDEPGFKIPYQITLEVPQAHLAVSNTPVETKTVKDGWRTVVFARTRPLPSYLLAIATGPLDTKRIRWLGVPGRVVTVKGRARLAGAAASMTEPILAALEKYFDRKYPYEKLDLIAIPDYWPGAMENPGAITFAEPLLLRDRGSKGPLLARVTAHELAHMWFGDLVTMQWWDDLWLNESFADWMGDKITGQVYPQFNVELSELQSIQDTMEADARPSTQAIRRDIKAGDNILENVGLEYNKGKAVLGMFERWVGPETFRKGVLDYIEANAWGNARASDLLTALSKASGLGVSLAAAMTTFIEQGGLPLVTVEEAGGGRVRLSQRRYLAEGVKAEPQRWQIPVQVRYSDGEATRTASVMLADTEQTLDLPGRVGGGWVLPDADARGYYRWSVPPEMLLAMARDAVTSLNPRERIGIIGNLSALLVAGSIHGDDYLRALGHFSHDPEPQVMSAVAGAIGQVRRGFVPDGMEDSFARYVRSTLGPALERFGLERRRGEDDAVSLFRPELVGRLGDEGRDGRILDHAQTLARRYMSNPRSVDRAMAEVALRLAALRGGKDLFEEYRKHIESAATPDERSRYLSACGSFRDPETVGQVLTYSLSGPLRPNEIFHVIGGLGATDAGADRLYRFMTDNYDDITSRIPSQFSAFMPFFASGCEAGRLEAARTFFADPKRDTPGTATSLAKVADQVTECVGLRVREGAAVNAFLKDFAGPPAAARASDNP